MMNAFDEVLSEFCQPADVPQLVTVVRRVAETGDLIYAPRIDLSTDPPTQVDVSHEYPSRVRTR